MTDQDLHVELQGGDIVVTMTGTPYRQVFRCTEDGLVSVSEFIRDDPENLIRPRDFAVRADKAARQMARQLRWIV
jgi:hypothetical protein